MVPLQTVIDNRKQFAKDAIQKEVARGGIIGGLPGLKRVLQQKVDDLGLPEDFFSSLGSEDLLGLVLDAMDSSKEAGSLHSGSESLATSQSPPTSRPTPDKTAPAPTTSYPIPDNTITPPDSSADEKGEDQLEEAPTYEDNEEPFDILIFHFLTARYDLLSASRCKQKGSYISDKIIRRNKLISHVCKDGTIRFTWKRQVAAKEGSRKTPSTRFRVINDADIMYDVAIGHGYDEDDEEDDLDDDQLPQKNRPGEESDEQSVNHDDIETEPGILSERFRQRLSLGVRASPIEEANQLNRDTIRNMALFWVEVQEELEQRPQLRRRSTNSSGGSSSANGIKIHGSQNGKLRFRD